MSHALLAGCREAEPPPPADPGCWRVIAAGPSAGVVIPAGAGGAVAPLRVDLEGPAGYVRATVTVERLGPAPKPQGELYDVLFPTPGRISLTAAVRPTGAGPGRAAVELRAESVEATSNSLVEPTVPLLANPAQVGAEGLIDVGQTIAGGREVEVGRWVTAEARVTVRVLPTRRPVGPRLKPEGKPPV